MNGFNNFFNNNNSVEAVENENVAVQDNEAVIEDRAVENAEKPEKRVKRGKKTEKDLIEEMKKLEEKLREEQRKIEEKIKRQQEKIKKELQKQQERDNKKIVKIVRDFWKSKDRDIIELELQLTKILGERG